MLAAGVEQGLQRSRSGMLSGKENIAPADLGGSLWLFSTLISIPHCHADVDVGVDPCSFLAMSKPIGEARRTDYQDHLL